MRFRVCVCVFVCLRVSCDCVWLRVIACLLVFFLCVCVACVFLNVLLFACVFVCLRVLVLDL